MKTVSERVAIVKNFKKNLAELFCFGLDWFIKHSLSSCSHIGWVQWNCHICFQV